MNPVDKKEIVASHRHSQVEHRQGSSKDPEPYTSGDESGFQVFVLISITSCCTPKLRPTTPLRLFLPRKAHVDHIDWSVQHCCWHLPEFL